MNSVGRLFQGSHTQVHGPEDLICPHRCNYNQKAENSALSGSVSQRNYLKAFNGCPYNPHWRVETDHRDTVESMFVHLDAVIGSAELNNRGDSATRGCLRLCDGAILTLHDRVVELIEHPSHVTLDRRSSLCCSRKGPSLFTGVDMVGHSYEIAVRRTGLHKSIWSAVIPFPGQNVTVQSILDIRVGREESREHADLPARSQTGRLTPLPAVRAAHPAGEPTPSGH
jgi:hypothetical protein